MALAQTQSRSAFRSEAVYRVPVQETAQAIIKDPEPKEVVLEARLPSVSLSEVVQNNQTIVEIHKANGELYLVDWVDDLIQRMFYKSGTERE